MQFYFNADDRASYRWDLGTRTDGQPLYQGKFENPPSNLSAAQLESVNGWQIHYFEYTTVGSMDIVTSKKVAFGKWADRATLTFI